MATKTADSRIKRPMQIAEVTAKIEKFSKFQPIDIKPRQGQDWILNGTNNSNFDIYKDAYDDSPTNSAIIDAYVSYMYGEGLYDMASGANLKQYLSNEDALIACVRISKLMEVHRCK
jgi:hypothetical protein